MPGRYLSLWFRHLTTDWFSLRRPALLHVPFVLVAADHNRKVVMAANALAQAEGVHTGMVVADARMRIVSLEVLDDRPQLPDKLLKAMALWCIRYTPIVAVDPPDGLVLDITGCAHLWGGEQPYLRDLITRLRSSGYDVRGAMADTVGAAWAVARFGRKTAIIESGAQTDALLSLSPAALRLEPAVLIRLQKLGFYRISQFAGMSRSALRRRFGEDLLLRMDQAFGQAQEGIVSVQPVEPYQERLPCLEPICTAGGIEIALTRLLETLCLRLQGEGKGLRTAIFKGYRVDGKLQSITIGTTRASHHIHHLFGLFQEKIQTMEPGLGIEVFQIDAPKVEDIPPGQETLWGSTGGLTNTGLSELLDRIANKTGPDTIHRYLPAEHYWPERSFKPAGSLQEKAISAWREDRARPVHLLTKPEPIEVTAPIPDYPPMLFRHKGKLHKILRADGPERIEDEWWIEGVQHRDYYAVEDEDGARYWIFRSGHYRGNHASEWFLHGFFA